MREILFRGKRKDNGEWVVGSLILTTSTMEKPYIVDSCWCYSESIDDEGYANFEYLNAYEVIPETIGQYTGLTENGKRIFEGDIVKGKDDLERNLEVSGYIDHKNGSFVIVGDFMTHYRWLDYELEVIGNIHDNPELLKGGDEK